tara:strand:+ start:311 stop:427 length:117 start_codon:yes stop_codon:yes gene_type:complete
VDIVARKKGVLAIKENAGQGFFSDDDFHEKKMAKIISK